MRRADVLSVAFDSRVHRADSSEGRDTDEAGRRCSRRCLPSPTNVSLGLSLAFTGAAKCGVEEF